MAIMSCRSDAGNGRDILPLPVSLPAEQAVVCRQDFLIAKAAAAGEPQVFATVAVIVQRREPSAKGFKNLKMPALFTVFIMKTNAAVRIAIDK